MVNADEESDADLLIVTSEPLTRFERHEITNPAFEVNLEFDTIFSTLVVDLKSWETGIISVLPYGTISFGMESSRYDQRGTA